MFACTMNLPGQHSVRGMRLPRLSVTLARGDILKEGTGALVTSANDSLVGNGQPMYWRFISRINVDGRLRSLAGPDLERYCLQMEPIPGRGFRRDITRWTSGVKHGASAVVRCPAGSAVTTPASGHLQCDHVVHAVVPDSEFGFEGIYTGGRLDQDISGAVAGSDTPHRFTGQQFSPPDSLLLSAYESAFEKAFVQTGVTAVACPALGTGVKGWKPAISAALAVEAAARLILPIDTKPAANGEEGMTRVVEMEAGGGSGHTVDVDRSLRFVIGGVDGLATACWKDWVRIAPRLLGPPAGLNDPHEYAAAARAGELRWELTPETLAPYLRGSGVRASDDGSKDFAAGHAGRHVLRWEEVDEMREMWKFREQGYSGSVCTQSEHPHACMRADHACQHHAVYEYAWYMLRWSHRCLRLPLLARFWLAECVLVRLLTHLRVSCAEDEPLSREQELAATRRRSTR